MSINQSIRYSNYGNSNNPLSLYDFIKPSRWIFNNVNPLPDTGEDQWFYINTVTGDLFEKTDGNWFLVYNFSTSAGTGITALQSDGGLSFVKPVIGNTGHFKGLNEGSVDEIIIDDSQLNEILFSMSPNYIPPLLSRVNNIKIGGDTFIPNNTFDNASGFNIGSLWTVVPSGTLYTCTNNTNGSAVWNRMGPYTASNVGLGGGQVFKALTSGDFELRTITGTTNQTVITTATNNVVISMDNDYKPVTLDNVVNVKNSYTGSAFSPTVNTDSTQGYQKGSVYSQVIGTSADMWVCADPTAGAAVWYDVGNKTSIIKDYAQFRVSDFTAKQTAIGASSTWYKLNLGSTALNNQLSSGTWSSVDLGSGFVIRRGPPTNGRSDNIYKISVHGMCYSVNNIADVSQQFNISFCIGSGISPSAGEAGSIAYLNMNTGEAIRKEPFSYSFMLQSVSSGNEDYFISVENATSTTNIFLEDVVINFEQIT